MSGVLAQLASVWALVMDFVSRHRVVTSLVLAFAALESAFQLGFWLRRRRERKEKNRT